MTNDHHPETDTDLDTIAPDLVCRALAITDAELAGMPAEVIETIKHLIDEWIGRTAERLDYARLAMQRLEAARG